MGAVGAVAIAETGPAPAVAGYARLRQFVHERTGMDLTPYKDRFLERRIAIRQRATSRERIPDYLRLLESDPAELDRLVRCLTIHVSTFFRNPSTYEAIRREVFPRLFGGGASRHVRFWSVGCSRGEEPYSLAILANEHLGAQRRGWDLQIHAIDVDDRVLLEAKAAEYGPNQLVDLPPGLRERYFSGEGTRLRLAPEIRRVVHFHRRDILMDPPGDGYDFVLCRNLLIYLDRAGQETVLQRFAHALRPGGYLVLGRTEVFVGAARAAFEVVDARERIYRRLPDTAAHGLVAARGGAAAHTEGA